MIYALMLFLLGAVACYLVLAWRQRQPGDSTKDALLRPWSGGGPRPGVPR